MQAPRPRGRRPAGSATREEILAAARAEFAEHGFEAGSMRAIARGAGVDPALVRHYFADKGELFTASVLPQGVDVGAVAKRVLGEGLPGLGGRLLAEVLAIWGDDDGARFRAAVGAVTAGDERTRAFVAYLRRNVFDNVTRMLPSDDVEQRVGMAASQVMGLLMLRYVFRVEPIVSMTVAEIVRYAGPTIDRYLTGPFPASS